MGETMGWLDEEIEELNNSGPKLPADLLPQIDIMALLAIVDDSALDQELAFQLGCSFPFPDGAPTTRHSPKS